MEKKNYHSKVLNEAFGLKQRDNKLYSLRAFARDLEMHPSTLSQVLSGKRPLPERNAKVIARKLMLTPQQKSRFLGSVTQSRCVLDQIKIEQNHEAFLIPESQFKIIAEWEHYAVITLFDVPGTTVTSASVADHLEITLPRAKSVLANLCTAELIVQKDEAFQRVHNALRTGEDVVSEALQKSHLETMDLGKKKLQEIEVDRRDFSSMNFAFDESKLPELKTVIREFRKKVMSLANKSESKSTVFQLAIQTYPITKQMTQ